MNRFSLLALATILTLSFLFNSCSSEPTAETGEGAVELLCDCFIEADIENEYDLMDLENDEDEMKDLLKCVIPVLKDIQNELDDLNHEDRALYFSEAIKAAVDCDCGVKLLEFASDLYESNDVEDEFDEMIDMLEWRLKNGNDYYYDDYSDYDDYEYDDYDYENDYDIYANNGWDIVVPTMDAFYYGDLELEYSGVYSIENVLDIYIDDYDGYGDEYISIDKDFPGYSFSLEFYMVDGILESVTCNTFYDYDAYDDAEDDSYELLDYLCDQFGEPEGGKSDYNDWTLGGQEISFNIFEDGYSLYVEQPYDYDDDYDYGDDYDEYDDDYYDPDCIGDFYNMKKDLTDNFIDKLKDGTIKLGQTSETEMKSIIGDEYDYNEEFDGISLMASFTYDGGRLSDIELDYFYECEGAMDLLDIDKESIKDHLDSEFSSIGEQEGDYEDADTYWYYKGMVITLAVYDDGYGIYIAIE